VQPNLFLLLPHYDTQGRAGAGVSECTELDQKAIAHWCSKCGQFAEGRGVRGNRDVGDWAGFAAPVNDEYNTVTALNAETKELKQAVNNPTAGREEGVKRAMDDDKIPSVSRILLLARESSSEFFLL